MTENDLFTSNTKFGAVKRLLPSDSLRNLSTIKDSNSISYQQINQNITYLNENISESIETTNFVKLFDEETDWNISYDSLNLLEKIAQGSFGVVYRASIEGSKESIAVKVQDVSENNLEEQINLLIEITCAKFFSHDNLVKCLGVGRTQSHPQQQNIRPKVFIALEYYERGTLREVLQTKLSWRHKLLMAKDIASGLACIHANNLIHRDIKTENILVNSRCRASICDFSFVCHRRSASKSQYTYGTDDFMSPEIALAADYDLASDIFSFGIVICELITGIPPSTTFMCRQPRNTFALDEEEVGRHVPLDCPEGLEALAYQCCDIDPKKRPTAVMCVEELELLAIELRIDEYESKSRMRDPNTIISTAPSSESIDLPLKLQQECSQKTDISPAEDAEFESKLYMDIKSKLATIEVEGEEGTENPSPSQQSHINESENSKVILDGDEFAPIFVNNEVDSHIEEKLKPMLQTMLGRLESIEQNLQRKDATVSNNSNNLNKTHGDFAYNQYHENYDFANTSVLSTNDGKESQELAGITALQAQIDELKAAMESMTLSSKMQSISTDKAAVDEMSQSLSPSTGKHHRGLKTIPENIQTLKSMSVDTAVQSSGNMMSSNGTQSYSDDFVKERRKKGGKWSLFFENMNLDTPSMNSQSMKTSRSFDIHETSTSDQNVAPQSRSERLKTHSIEFNELHFMHQNKQIADDISIEVPQVSEKPNSRMNGMQIVEHVAYTIDKQPLHVTEKLFPPQSNQNGSNSNTRKNNRASEQLSKALGSFLDVISRCNETSTAAIEAVNSVDDAVLGLRSPVVPAMRHIPISSSSSKSNEHLQMVLVDQDSVPIYSKSNAETATSSRISIDTSNNYNPQLREQYNGTSMHLPNQQSHRTTTSFNQSSLNNQVYLPEDNNYHHQTKQHSSHHSMISLQSPNFIQNPNGSRQRKPQTPHYATSTKSKSISSPRIQHTMDPQHYQQPRQQQRSSSSPNRSRSSGFKSPSLTSMESNGRSRNQSDWASKEALSTRKSPFAYSFPSDTKPRLSFEATASTSRPKSPVNIRRQNVDSFSTSNLSSKSTSSALPLSAALQRR